MSSACPNTMIEIERERHRQRQASRIVIGWIQDSNCAARIEVHEDEREAEREEERLGGPAHPRELPVASTAVAARQIELRDRLLEAPADVALRDARGDVRGDEDLAPAVHTLDLRGARALVDLHDVEQTHRAELRRGHGDELEVLARCGAARPPRGRCTW